LPIVFLVRLRSPQTVLEPAMLVGRAEGAHGAGGETTMVRS
jgi:hypothetical protein